MDRGQVESSNIVSVGYDAATMILEVEFISGAVWQYTGVSGNIFKAFMESDSLGKFFMRNIKPNYRGRRA
jgi:hypothetical protein